MEFYNFLGFKKINRFWFQRENASTSTPVIRLFMSSIVYEHCILIKNERTWTSIVISSRGRMRELTNCMHSFNKFCLSILILNATVKISRTCAESDNVSLHLKNSRNSILEECKTWTDLCSGSQCRLFCHSQNIFENRTRHLDASCNSPPTCTKKISMKEGTIILLPTEWLNRYTLPDKSSCLKCIYWVLYQSRLTEVLSGGALNFKISMKIQAADFFKDFIN